MRHVRHLSVNQRLLQDKIYNLLNPSQRERANGIHDTRIYVPQHCTEQASPVGWCAHIVKNHQPSSTLETPKSARKRYSLISWKKNNKTKNKIKKNQMEMSAQEKIKNKSK